MKSKPRIAYIGDLTADVYVDSGVVKLGGAALNMAVWTKRIGGVPEIFSAVGTDTIGKKFPKKQGIQRKRGRTSTIEIIVSDTGERQYGTWNPGVLATYHLRKKDTILIQKKDAAVITVYPPHLHTLSELPETPWNVINWGEFYYDISSIEKYSQNVQMLVFGLDKDKDEQRINALRDFSFQQRKLTIVTMGQWGSIAWYEGKSYAQPAQKVNVVDTTGAGDAFLVGFLVNFLKTRHVQQSLKRGSETAARAVGILGAY